MASMKEDIGDLGAIGIVREAFKIYRTYSKVFLLIQFTLIIDMMTVGIVAQYFLLRPDSLHPLGLARNLHSRIAAAATGTSPIINIVLSRLTSVVVILVCNAVLSLSLSATLHSVALHYAGQAVSFGDVIRASVLRLWMRLAITSSYGLLMANAIVLVQAISTVLFAPGGVFPLWMALSSVLVLSLSSVVFMIGLNIIFTVAQGVSIFEEDYGWAAARKGLKLLKGKVGVAINLNILLSLQAIIPMGLTFAFTHGFGEWTFLIRVVTAAAFIVWSSFTKQLITVCFGVQYASFKAYHKSTSITDSIRAEKVGYERVWKGADDLLIRGQETDSKV